MTESEKKVYDLGVLPVIKIDDPENAVPLARALCNGGLPAAEITFRTACAAEAIKRIKAELPDMLLIAGTVLTTKQADEAVEAGAEIIVSPGLNPKVVEHCIKKGVPVIPGISNPSDIETALELGLKTVKFFPAEACGGLKMLKAMSAPYGSLMFMPTGGINADNLLSYLKFDKILCCGGSFMVPSDLIAAKEFGKIEELTRNAVSSMLGFELAHIGINTENREEAEKYAKLLCAMFGWSIRETSKSYFSSEKFEIMFGKGPGRCGHIAIATNFVDRAVAYFKRMGVEIDESTLKTDAKGKPTFVYLKDEICGFAVHLVLKK
ncbi:MAG: bifunctional 4-hydroxy-2-oxoglutarate aldolase/2-dehydro-3-deoxy-phosphogluconate aldolase [Eubacteriales bacterium]|nr:bifunctional 4-hydroxy-2-oxoglutarate aldolase/2-dehydro-3-deoxy-phosphogluconate aldolase [Eubacteriales bacterium]